MEKKTSTNTNIITKIFGEGKQKTVNLLILLSCYIIAIFVLILLNINSQSTLDSISAAPKAMEAELVIINSPLFLGIIVIEVNLIALPLFGVWLLLQHTAFKKITYNNKTVKIIRNIDIILIIVLFLVLVIQAARY